MLLFVEQTLPEDTNKPAGEVALNPSQAGCANEAMRLGKGETAPALLCRLRGDHPDTPTVNLRPVSVLAGRSGDLS